MLTLTESQTNILRTIIDRENQLTSDKKHGLTSYQIRKMGIPGRTFDINLHFLLKNQLISLIRSEKTGKQIRRFYSSTPIGVFTVLKSLNFKDAEIEVNFLSGYVTLLAKNWKEL